MNKLLFVIIPVLIIISLFLGLIPPPKQECFTDFDPHELIGTLRTLLDKYDNPELWSHAKRVHKMSPGELARDHLKL